MNTLKVYMRGEPRAGQLCVYIIHNPLVSVFFGIGDQDPTQALEHCASIMQFEKRTRLLVHTVFRIFTSMIVVPQMYRKDYIM